MTVTELVPDRAPVLAAPRLGGGFAALVDAAATSLAAADRAEQAFAAQRGGLQEMVVARARADIALQIAAAGAQRATQAVQTLLGMQL